MKIGIITIHNSYNYGATLQAYALWECIAQMGADVEIINLRRPGVHEDYVASEKYKPYKIEQSLVGKIKCATKSLLTFCGLLHTDVVNHVAKEKFGSFFDLTKLTRPYKCIDELYDNPPEYDLYITGSDQVWNPTMRCCIEPYFLTFTGNQSRCISFASSIAVTSLSSNVQADFKKWLSHYEDISVREAEGKNIIEDLLSRPVKLMPDPTFLLTPEFWVKLSKSPYLGKKYILLFPLHRNNKPLIDFSRRLAVESGIDLVVMNNKMPDGDCSYEIFNDAGPREFIGTIAHAEMVITDSFHGTVFSLLTGAKNFFSYISPKSKRGSRITNLLSTFSLDDHIISLEESYKDLNSRKIDLDSTKRIIESIRQTGIDYLSTYVYE